MTGVAREADYATPDRIGSSISLPTGLPAPTERYCPERRFRAFAFEGEMVDVVDMKLGDVVKMIRGKAGNPVGGHGAPQAFADVDGDGDEDALSGFDPFLWRNDGRGTMVPEPLLAGSEKSSVSFASA